VGGFISNVYLHQPALKVLILRRAVTSHTWVTMVMAVEFLSVVLLVRWQEEYLVSKNLHHASRDVLFWNNWGRKSVDHLANWSSSRVDNNR